MSPERWQQIEKLLQAALERKPAERAAFLQQACAGDEVIRKEVESLLASNEHADSFSSPPPFKMLPHCLLKSQPLFNTIRSDPRFADLLRRMKLRQ